VGPTAFLGVVLKNVSGGTRIQQVLPNLPADTAGLVAGDVITSLNGLTIATMDDMRDALLTLPVGTAVPIGFTDTNGVSQTGSITPASGPPQ
jgi:S1-C subfamily serine protease